MANDAQVQPNGQPVLPGQWGTNQLDSQNLGFLAAHAKWRILRVERGFGLALGGARRRLADRHAARTRVRTLASGLASGSSSSAASARPAS